MTLVAERIDRYRNYQTDPSRNRWFKLTLPGSGERVRTTDVTKFSESNSGSICSSATIRPRGVRDSHTFTEFNIQSLNLTSVNISGVMTSGSSSGPSANSEYLGLNSQSPFRVEFKHISPTNGYVFNGIGNDDSFITESDLGAKQKDVDAEQHKTRDEDAYNFTGRATLVKTRPREKSTENDSNASKNQIGVWSVRFNVGHTPILPHQASNKVKAVQ